MTTAILQPNVNIADLEPLVRRMVHEMVHEELGQLVNARRKSILDDWTQEGSDDSAEDATLLAEALVLSEQRSQRAAPWKSWDAFKVELMAAEDAGELPN